MRSQLLILVFLGLSTPAAAMTCEESFQKKGDFFNGSAYSARIQVEGGTVERAFAQLRPILAREGIKTVSSDLENGVLKAENPATPFQRALPIDVFAFVDGSLLNVEMVFRLPSGVTAGKETIKKHLCTALNQLLPRTDAAVSSAPIAPTEPATSVTVAALVKQVQETAENPASLRLNFVGKVFQVSGTVTAITEAQDSYAVSFSSTQANATPQANPGPNAMTVQCLMAKNQDTIVAGLKTNQPTTLVGRFQGVDRNLNTIKLQECRGV